MEFVQDFAGFFRLIFGPSPDRGAATNDRVLLFDFRGTATGNERTNVFLESAKGD